MNSFQSIYSVQVQRTYCISTSTSTLYCTAIQDNGLQYLTCTLLVLYCNVRSSYCTALFFVRITRPIYLIGKQQTAVERQKIAMVVDAFIISVSPQMTTRRRDIVLVVRFC